MKNSLCYINGIKFIGDLSLQDADILAYYGSVSKSILEFGCGGSTQIFSQICKDVTSVETDQKWIDVTKKRISKIENSYSVEFKKYSNIPTDQTFDLIFVDGVDNLRRQFAIDTWKYLNIGGVMIFHDTRRFQDFQNAAWVAQLYHNEIEDIKINAKATDLNSSNITIIRKKKLEEYVNWNHSENKPMWAYGDPKYDGEILSWENV